MTRLPRLSYAVRLPGSRLWPWKRCSRSSAWGLLTSADSPAMVSPLTVIDPAPVGDALSSLSPVLFLVASVIFQSVTVSVILLGTGFGDAGRYLEPAKHSKKVLDRVGWLVGLLATISFPGLMFMSGYLPVFKLAGVGPMLFWQALLCSTLLALLLIFYDLLTTVIAVATVAFWTLNYPLLLVNREVGNSAQWAAFVIWAALVLGASAVAFRTQLHLAAAQVRRELDR